MTILGRGFATVHRTCRSKPLREPQAWLPRWAAKDKVAPGGGRPGRQFMNKAIKLGGAIILMLALATIAAIPLVRRAES